MRGLPPPPSDVAQVTASFDVDGSPASLAFWLFVPGLQTLAVSQLEDVAASFTIFLESLSGAITHRGCSLVRVDLRRWGSSPLNVTRVLLPASGRWTGGQLLVGALTLHLLSGEGGRGHDSVVHFPGFPDVFSDDHRSLNALGWGTAQSEALHFFANVNAMTSPAGGNCVLGTVHRAEGGAPLAIATFGPAIGIVPGLAIGTLDRRRL